MKIVVLLFSMVLVSSSYGQNYTTVKVGPDEKISLKVPDEFILMTDQDRMRKVYSTKVPLAMYTNDSQEVTFGINYNVMQWTENDTEMIYGFYKASINNLFDTTVFIQDEIKEINGRKFLVFEFTGTIENDNAFSSRGPQKNYSYIVYTSWNDQVLLFNFSCKARLMNQWKEVADYMMNSIKIKS